MDIVTYLVDMPENVAELLRVRFGSSALAYHNFNHIEHCFETHSTVFAPDMSERENRIMRWLIWSHDYFYDPRRTDNEERSATDFVRQHLGFLPSDELDIVYRGTLASKGHHTDDPFIQKFIDLDLSILAAWRPAYQKYALAIRSEYSFYPEADYRTGRVEKVLKPFIHAPILLESLSIGMGLDPDAMGNIARDNMRWEIERLEDASMPLEEALSV